MKELAEVSVNGKSLGLRWHAPFQIDVTSALQPGVNKLEIKVTNLWQNRMIGEQLAISPRTVEIHRANMLNKMGASRTSEAIRIAIEASLVG